jgi:hypothetical protein
MPTLEFTAPLKLTLTGTPEDEQWQRLEDVLTRHYARVLQAGGQGAAPGLPEPGGETPREWYDDEATLDDDYLLPGFDGGGARVPVPMRGGAAVSAGGRHGDTLTFEQAIAAIDAAFPPGTGDPAVRRGVYTRLGDGPLEVHYAGVEGGYPVLRAVLLWSKRGDEKLPIALEPGGYTLIVRPHGRGQLYRGGRLLLSLANPDNLNLAVNFVVPAPAGEVLVTGYRYRWYPRMQLLRLDDDPNVATGAESTFLAAPEIWGVDEHQNPYPVFGLAWIYLSLRYRFEIWRRPARGTTGPPVCLRAESGTRAFLRHVWDTPGEYEIKATMWLEYEDADPHPVTDSRRLTVVALDVKMALTLAALEKREKAGKESVFARSTLQLRLQLTQQLERELARPEAERSQARIDYLNEQIAKFDSHLSELADGPWPIRAIFTEPRTGETRALQLFVGAARGDPDDPITWQLVDLTYPAFYATYTGTGQSHHEALLATFEDARTRFKATYPRGRILARIEFPGMERYGVRGQDFPIETESWQRTAYEWLGIGASVIGAVGLVAFVFPPSAVVVGVLVVGATAGAAVAAIDIAERIHTGNFEWDAQTWTDIGAIAAAILTLGAARVGALAREVVAGVEATGLTAEAAAQLANLARIQRGLLIMGIGTDVGRGILIAVETYQEIRNLEVSFPPELIAEYERIWPGHGRERWEMQRQAQMVGILARAAVNGTLTLVSLRAQVKAFGELAPRPGGAGLELPPGQPSRVASEVSPPPTAEESALLRASGDREGARLTPHEVDVELEVALRAKRRPSTLEGYVDEVELENGHIWRRRADGRWCRFSNGGFCPTVSRTVAGTPPRLPRLAEAAGARDALDEGRIVVLLHGTTDTRARQIATNPEEVLSPSGGQFQGRFFTATDLAVIDEFAARTVGREGGEPGVLGIAMSEETAARLRAIRVRGTEGRLVPALRTEPIQDRPGLYQTVFEPAAIPILTSEGFFFAVTR